MRRYIILGFFFALLLAGCGLNKTPQNINNPPTGIPIVYTDTPVPPPTNTATPSLTPTVTQTPTPTATPTPVVYGPTNFPQNVDPLTGIIVNNASLLNRRPVAIKVNVVPRTTNRPPWGLAFADIVYDYYHNDGYSRFHVIFYGKDASLVGPIRSGRLLDYELIHMYQSIFAYGSADALINARLLHSDFSDRVILEGSENSCPPSGSPPFCRFGPATYDILLSDTAKLSAYITSRGVSNGRQNLEGMYFNSSVPSGNVTGTQLFVRYSGDNYTRWDYNPLTGKYLRFQDKVFDTGQGEDYEPLTDRLNNQQITADNVVVVLARHEFFQEPPAEIIDILLDGTGTAYAFRDGQMYEVKWNRPTTNSVLSLSFADGTPFPFKPGNTWFQVVGVSTVPKKQSEGVYRFNFLMP